MAARARHLRPADDMDPEERDRVRAAAENWRKATLACRLNGHAWSGWTVAHRPGVYTITQRCTRRCGLYREADMNEQGYLISKWKPTYPPEGYLMPRGAGRVTADGKAELRMLTLLDAAVVEVADDA